MVETGFFLVFRVFDDADDESQERSAAQDEIYDVKFVTLKEYRGSAESRVPDVLNTCLVPVIFLCVIKVKLQLLSDAKGQQQCLF